MIKQLNIFLLFFTLIFSTMIYAENVIDDSAITSKIKAKILVEKNLSVFNPSINTKNGVVYLTGTVDSQTQASELVQIAQSTEGVKDVNVSALQVKDSSQPMDDLFITAKIKGLFVQEKLFGDKPIDVMSISVETNNGVVYLSGSADTQEIANNAIKIAKSVRGVKTVESSIKVETKTT